MQMFGYGVALVGFTAYNVAKVQAKEQEILEEQREAGLSKPLLP
jgi:hypothetical protein